MIIQDLKIFRGDTFAAYFVIEDLDFFNTDLVAHVRERRLDAEIQIEFTKSNNRIVDASVVNWGITPALFSGSKIAVADEDRFEGISLPASVTISGSVSDDGVYPIEEIVNENTISIFHTFTGSAAGATIGITSPGRIGLVLTSAETLAIDFDRGHWDLVTNFNTNPTAIIGGRVAIDTRVTREEGSGDILTPVTYVDATGANLNDLLNVGGIPTDGQVLTYNAASGAWVPTDTSASGPGSVLTSAGTSLVVPTSETLEQFTIIRNTGTANLTISTEGTETIDGAIDAVLSGPGEAMLVYSAVGDKYYIFTLSGIVTLGAIGAGPTGPAANFTTSVNDLTATFQDVSAPGSSSIVSWLWTFPDASTSTLQNPVFVDTNYGTKSATLTVTNANALTSTITKTYTLSNTATPPSADFTTVVNDLTATFTDTSTQGTGTIASWLWTFDDNSTSTLQNPVFVDTSYGSKTATLLVTDSNNLTSTINKTYSLSNAATPPNANFTTAVSGLTANFTDTSTAGSSSITSWLWTFPDSSTSALQNPTFTDTTYGSKSATLLVTDANSQTSTITKSYALTTATPPVANFSETHIGLDTTFVDSSTPGSGTITSWLWTFDDNSTSTLQNPTFTDTTYGTGKNVSLQVTNSDSLSDTYSKTYNLVAPNTISEPVLTSNVAPVHVWRAHDLTLSNDASVSTLAAHTGSYDFTGTGTIFKSAGVGAVASGAADARLVAAGSTGALNMMHDGNGGTMAAVVKITSATAIHMLIGNHTGTRGFQTLIQESGNLFRPRFQIETVTNDGAYDSPYSNDLTDGEFHLLVFRADADGTMSTWIDGVEVSVSLSGRYTGEAGDADQNLTVFTYPDPGNLAQDIDAELRDLRFYDYSLTTADQADLFTWAQNNNLVGAV